MTDRVSVSECDKRRWEVAVLLYIPFATPIATLIDDGNICWFFSRGFILRNISHRISWNTSDNFTNNKINVFLIWEFQEKTTNNQHTWWWLCALFYFAAGYNVCQYRVARIFGKKTGAAALTCPRAKYISPRSQLAITGALTLIEVVVNASWLIYEPPRTKHIFPDR